MAEREKPLSTGKGFASFPYLAAPDTGRPQSCNKYSLDIFVAKPDFKISGPALLEAVLRIGRAGKGDPKAILKDFKLPFTDVDKLSDEKKAKLPEQVRSGFMLIKARSKNQPLITGPKKIDGRWAALNPDEVKTITGGDICNMVVGPFWYSQQGGGVAFGLNIVQFIQKGKPFGGQGVAQSLEQLHEMEVTAEDAAVDAGSDDMMASY